MVSILTCVISVVGLLALQKAIIATPLMIPLIVMTVLFNAYIRQQHFHVAEYLPSRECIKADLSNGYEFDMSFTKDAYLQEELREKVRYPENLTDEQMHMLDLTDPESEHAQSQQYGAC